MHINEIGYVIPRQDVARRDVPTYYLEIEKKIELRGVEEARN